MHLAYNEGVVEIPDGPALPHGILVDGRWLSIDGPARPIIDPADGSILATVVDAGPEHVDMAVQSARRAFPEWSRRSVSDRAAILEAVADRIRDNADLLAATETRDTGKPLSQSATDVSIAEQYFRYYAHAAMHLFGDTIPSAPHLVVRTEREPFGVVAHITPWNAPLSQLTRGVAPSLAVGNTVVVKPSELAPLSSLLFADLVREILPPGVMTLLQGDGPNAGAALAGHPGIDHLTFTGSVTTGIAVSQAAAANVVATNLELGGKSAGIVFEDADLDAAARSAANALVRNSGQSCSALTRFIVHRSVAERFEELVVRAVARLTVGRGLDDPDVGPLVSATQRDRVLGLVRRAVDEGARIAIGSQDPPTDPALAFGWFAQPTVLADVTPSMEVAVTEVFGPVQSILTFDTEEEAVTVANSTDYGLASAVFTADLDRATRLARSLQAGQVQLNGFIGAGMEIPFGGVKHSGHGREKGFEALYGYTQVKAIVTHLTGSAR